MVYSAFNQYFVFLTVICFSSFLITKVYSITVPGRFEPRCAYFAGKNKIYCDGGTFTSADFDNTTYSLDLNSLSAGGFNTSVEQISTLWSKVTPTNTDYIVEKRKKAAFASVNNTMIIAGGFTVDTRIVNQTISFNMETETWETLTDYLGYENEVKQIYKPTIAYSPLSSKVYIYGGLTAFPTSNTYTFTDFPMMTVKNITIGSGGKTQTPINGLGYTQSTMYDINSKTWSIASPQQKPLSTDCSINQNSIYDTVNNMIYYMGGNVSASGDSFLSSSFGPLNRAVTFNINNGEWGTVYFGGDVPNPRNGASMTFLPKSRHAVFFGGDPGNALARGTALKDFCYTLNLDTKTWTHRKIDLPSVSTMASRADHSAVLVNDTSLFILFGTYMRENINDLLILDVKDVDNIRFVTTYPYADRSSTPGKTGNDNTSTNGGANSSTTEQESGGLGQGTIIGISVGCAILIASVIGCFVFYNHKKKKRAMEEEKRQHQIDEVLVDWDLIEKQCDDLSSPVLPQKKQVMLTTPDIGTGGSSTPTSHQRSLSTADQQNLISLQSVDQTLASASESGSNIAIGKSKEFRLSGGSTTTTPSPDLTIQLFYKNPMSVEVQNNNK